MAMRGASRLRLVQPEVVGDTPNNLPRQLTSFVGRQEEVRHARRLLHGARLLTLTGGAGAGKSRLAIRLAEAELGVFAGGVWLVELAPLDRPHLIASTIAAQMVGLPELTGADTVKQLSLLLDRRPLLILLDNCEHLAEACAGVVLRLLDAAPLLKLVVTSREPLGVAGETIYTVPPLSLPDESAKRGAPGRSDAVQLFVDRLRAHAPDFAPTEPNLVPVIGICRRLDGLPLAIELAAAHARHLSLPDLEAQLAGGSLRGAPERTTDSRHRSLAYALDRSYELLSDPERDLFLSLSVCAGDFDLDAASAIGATKAALATPPELVWRLVDRSLLTVTQGARGRSRYRMLEPVRQDALHRLTARGGLAGAQERHARHFAGVVGVAAEELRGVGQVAWLDRLDEEHANIRAALEWSCGEDPAQTLTMAIRLRFFWSLRGHVAEGKRWLERALLLAGETDSQRGWGLAALAWLMISGPDPKRLEALAPAEEALALAVASSNNALRVRALLALGHGSLTVDRERSAATFARAVTAARQNGESTLVAEALAEEAIARLMIGQREVANVLATEALSLARELGNQHLIWTSATVLARDATYQGRPEAERLWVESLASGRELGDAERIRFCLGWLADLAASRGDFEAAAAALESDLQLTRTMGSEDGKVQLLDDAAVLAFHAGQPSWSLRLASAAHAGKGQDWVESPFWAIRMAEVIDGSRAMLAAPVADQAWAEGAKLPPDARLSATESMLREVERLKFRRRRSHGGLSDREAEVARLIGLGLTNREVAIRLFISERTAEGHVQHILNKRGFGNRTQIAAWVADGGPAANPA